MKGEKHEEVKRKEKEIKKYNNERKMKRTKECCENEGIMKKMIKNEKNK
jgi:hypothetical protein